MKINKGEVIVCEAGWRNLVYVRLFTDAGLIGQGEATLQKKEKALFEACRDLVEKVVGQDPSNLERLWHTLFIQDHWRGGVIYTSAISAIDQALWDIHAKNLQVPVCQLLGGHFHSSVRLYANGWFRDVTTIDGYVTRAEQVTEQGFTALKFNPFIAFLESGMDRKKSIRTGIECFQAVRASLGPDIDLLVDVHGLFDTTEAHYIIEQLAPAYPFFIEEPVHPDNTEGMRLVLNHRKAQRIAAGERWFNRWDYWNALSNFHLDVIQPDVSHCGGISELKKIATMAEARYTTVAPHNSNSPLATLAASHVMTTCPNFLIQEYFVNDTTWQDELLLEPLDIQNGNLILSTRPGYGTDLNMSLIEKHLLQKDGI